VLLLDELSRSGLFPAEIGATLTAPILNDFMALGRGAWRATRARLQALLAAPAEAGADGALRENAGLCASALVAADAVRLVLPARIGDYTDFYSSRDHASNVGVMLRGAANALQPNWLWLPVGYHGRASSVVVSGVDVVRPCGQLQVDAADPSKGAVFGPTKRLDFELEVATWVGTPSALGEPVRMADAVRPSSRAHVRPRAGPMRGCTRARALTRCHSQPPHSPFIPFARAAFRRTTSSASPS
jgi:fumarylacetoacetase